MGSTVGFGVVGSNVGTSLSLGLSVGIMVALEVGAKVGGLANSRGLKVAGSVTTLFTPGTFDFCASEINVCVKKFEVIELFSDIVSLS